jgi:peptidyl-prolyl cis-trans isomerase D
MSVIQKIRDKYARWAVIAIAVSLLGFILMDAFAGRTGLFSNRPSNTLGKVNGVAIDRIAFEQKIKEQEDMAAQQGYQLGDQERQQIQQGLWDQEVTNIIMNDEYKKLGLTVTDKELRDILYGQRPPQFLSQAFTDSSGRFNGSAAQQQVNKLLKSGTQDQKDYINKQIEYAKDQRLMNKYMAMLTNTVYFPSWFLEKRNVDNSLIGKISYVNVPYASIPDSIIKVSDNEIKDYIKAHRDEFEQKEETRSISYVLFSANPSAADSAEARNSLLALKAGFDTTKNIKQFVEVNNTSLPFYDSYLSKKAIQQPNKDSILSAPVGVVYGPYVDMNQGNTSGVYVLSKILDVKNLPDTVKVRHILVATAQRTQTGELTPVREDSAAKHLIDSVQGLLNKGQSFDSLVAKFSDDPGSKAKGGVYDNITTGQMTTGFNDYIFQHKTGERGIVKTEFGYHLIEILSQKGSSPAYKIAYLTKPIITSPETDQEAHNQANLFAGDSRDLKSFNENYDKNLRPKGIAKLVASDITPMDYNIQGMQTNARSFIKKVYETDKGDVLGPEKVGENYVVAVITEVNEPGLRTVSAVRPMVEPLLKNKKKGEQIARNIGQVTTLEQVASKTGQQVQTADSLRLGGGTKLNYEPKILGAAFNPNNKGKVVPEPIAGASGVFALRVDNTGTTPVESGSIEEQRKMLEMQTKQDVMSQMQQGRNPIIDVLKRAAKIRDDRAKFF